jgi:phytoene desaturase
MMSAKMTARIIAQDYGIPESIMHRAPESLQAIR